MSESLDTAQGLQHCNHDITIYRAVLQQFLLQYRDGLDINALLTDSEHAQITLHTLKGLCATIGALPLSSLAAHSYHQWPELTADEAKYELQQVNHHLERVIQAIDHFLAALE